MAVHHAVGISCQRNSGYSPTHLSIRRGRARTTHYTHHQVSLMVSYNTTLVPSLGLRIGPACEAGLSAGMRRECVPSRKRKKEKKERYRLFVFLNDKVFEVVEVILKKQQNCEQCERVGLLHELLIKA